MANRYVFNVTAINANSALEQVAFALEKRTELISRLKSPKMWAYTDKLNTKEKVSKEVSKKRRIFRKIMSVINLVLGVLLVVPALMEPKELTFILVVGVFAIVIGLIGLFGGVFSKKADFIKPAQKLLNDKQNIINGENQVLFLDEHMEVHIKLKEDIHIPYADFEYLIETKDIFLITYKGMITVLQKQDLQNDMLQDFRAFLRTKEFYIPLV